ncbi:MAG: hypothetical protein RLZZ71_151 [Bacteroidota bacterium]
MKKKRREVYIFLDSPSRKGGIETFTLDLLEALGKSGYNSVKIVYIHSDFFYFGKTSISLKKSWSIGLKRLFLHLYIKKDALLIFHQPGHLKYCQRNTENVYLFVHNPSDLIKFRILNKLNRITLLCVGRHLLDHLRTFSNKKIVVIPPIQKNEKKRLVSNFFRFVHIGRLSPEKCVDKSIYFIKELAQDFRELNFVLHIYGEGSEKYYLSELIRNNSIENLEIKLFEWIDKSDIFRHFENYDFYLSMSSIEGMPIALREAMISSLIPVVSDISAHREIIKSNENGYIVDNFFHSSNFVTEMRQLDLRRNMVVNGKKVLENHHFDDFYLTIENLF